MKIQKKHIVIFLIIILLIPIVIFVCYKFAFKSDFWNECWDINTALLFYGAVLTFGGTVYLGYVSLKQNDNLSKTNLDFSERQAKENKKIQEELIKINDELLKIQKIQYEPSFFLEKIVCNNMDSKTYLFVFESKPKCYDINYKFIGLENKEKKQVEIIHDKCFYGQEEIVDEVNKYTIRIEFREYVKESIYCLKILVRYKTILDEIRQNNMIIKFEKRQVDGINSHNCMPCEDVKILILSYDFNEIEVTHETEI